MYDKARGTASQRGYGAKWRKARACKLTTDRPFCKGKPARDAYDRWVKRLAADGIELTEVDTLLVGTVASREARLEELTTALAKCHDEGHRLRLLAAERAAAADVVKALELAERTYGEAAAAESKPAAAAATGTDGRVVAFPKQPSVVGQRITQALAGGALTRATLRRRVRGSENDFGAALREVVKAGSVRRTGAGSKGKPYRYERG